MPASKPQVEKSSGNKRRMPANTPQIEKTPANRRRYAASVDILGAFYPIKFQAQAYCSLNFKKKNTYIFLGSGYPWPVTRSLGES